MGLSPRSQRQRLRDRFPQTSLRGVGIREDLEVIEVSELLARIHVDQLEA